MTKHRSSLTSLLMLLLIVSTMSLIRPPTKAKSTILTTGLTSPNDFSTVQAPTSVVDSKDNKSVGHKLRITITGCGGISPDEGTHTYENGTIVSVSASESFSAYGTFFSYWLVDGAQ